VEETKCLSASTVMQVEAKVKNSALLELDRKALAARQGYIDHTVALGSAVTRPTDLQNSIDRGMN
jgi:hypothetical protein